MADIFPDPSAFAVVAVFTVGGFDMKTYTAQVDAHGNWIVTDHIARPGYRVCFTGSYEACKAFAARGIAS